MNPTARVEYALRADDALGEAQVRQVMEYYLAVRMRRYARPVAPPTSRPTYPPIPARQGPTALASVAGGSPAPDRGMLTGRSSDGHQAAEPNTLAPPVGPSPSGSQAQRTLAFWGAGGRAFRRF
jgi:hypothetical protein